MRVITHTCSVTATDSVYLIASARTYRIDAVCSALQHTNAAFAFVVVIMLGIGGQAVEGQDAEYHCEDKNE